MNLTEATTLLAFIAVGDNRSVDEVHVRYWQDLLGDLDLAPCLEAVREHRRTCTDYLLPAHVRTGVARAARAAARAAVAPALPSGPAAFQRTPEQDAYVSAQADRVRRMVTQIAGKLPEPDDRWIPTPLGPRPPREVSAQRAAAEEAERARQLRALEAVMNAAPPPQ